MSEPRLGTPTVSATNVRLSEFRVWGYACCSFCNDFMIFWVNAYMMFYFTDIFGVQVAFIPALMLFVRIFDAINDPILGWIQDRGIKSKMGRYRPWLLWGGFAYAAALIILFNGGNFDFSANGKVVFMYIAYISFTIFQTMYNMAKSAFMCVITSDADSRNRLASRRMVASNAANGSSGIFAVICIVYFSDADGAMTQDGFTPAVIIWCAIAVGLNIVGVNSNIERIMPAPDAEKISLLQAIKTLKGNVPALFLYVGYGLFGFIVYGILPMFTYYYTYVAGDATFMSTHSLFYGVGAMVGSYFLAPFIMKRVSSKKYTLSLGLLWFGVLFFIQYIVAGRLGGPAGDYNVLYWALIFIAPMGIGTFLTGVFSTLPEVTDLGEYNSGVRADSFVSAVSSTALKLGGAIAPAIGASMLANTGYVANAVQSPETLQAMVVNISIIPGIAGVVGAAIMFFYPMTNTKVNEIREALESKRLEAEAKAES